MVELTDVSHGYGGQEVLTNLTIRFQENKITAIIGKSGSGKSTLLQLINGLLRPSKGQVSVFNQPLNYQQTTSLRLRMGYMVQGTGLFPHLTIAQNIAIAGKVLDNSKPGARVNELMELVGLPSSYQPKYPYELSGGEQQRVGICRALYLNPPLLLMDEPMGALDPITRQDIQQEIMKLQRLAPRTMLLVTHDMREAKKLADFILVLARGKVQQFDRASNVISEPATQAVRDLINASIDS
ncbi:MAG: ATP-binding cassette domain-containing protein [Cyclobacteriaceae bacterium]|jgi:osmoprotectant transport system ATP-binding protein